MAKKKYVTVTLTLRMSEENAQYVYGMVEQGDGPTRLQPLANWLAKYLKNEVKSSFEYNHNCTFTVKAVGAES